MSENDYIAEYIKEKHPHLLTTVDFAFWKVGRMAGEIAKSIAETFKTIDFNAIPTDQLLGETENE